MTAPTIESIEALRLKTLHIWEELASKLSAGAAGNLDSLTFTDELRVALETATRYADEMDAFATTNPELAWCKKWIEEQMGAITS